MASWLRGRHVSDFAPQRGIMTKRVLALLLWLWPLLGCSSPLITREKGALADGAIGAGTGAIVDSRLGRPGAGAPPLRGRADDFTSTS